MDATEDGREGLFSELMHGREFYPKRLKTIMGSKSRFLWCVGTSFVLFCNGCEYTSRGPLPGGSNQSSNQPTQSATATAAAGSEILTEAELNQANAKATASATPSFYTVAHYGNDRDAEADLAMTLERAAREKKRVLIQVGGDWCGWCKLMTNYFDTNEPVRASLEKNYVLMKVTYNSEQTNEKFLSKFPKVSAYPHLFVLESDGTLLKSQDTGVLEEGKGYNQKVVLEFLDQWKPGT